MDMKQFSANYSMKPGDNDLDTIATAYAKIIQEEIDNEIMINMMKMNGWYIVALPRYIDMKHPIDIEEWCNITLGGSKMIWSNFGTTYLFKEKEHAEWFSLRWL
jgi:hypothetical protein